MAFGISHFAEPVVYNADNFVQHATEKIPEHLLKAVAKSTNGVVSYEISEFMKESNANNRKKSRSVIDKFRRQLKLMLATIDGADTYYVRCIRTNETTGKKVLSHTTIARQLRYSQVVSTINLGRPMFAHTMSFEDVKARFLGLVAHDKVSSIEELGPAETAQFLLSILYAPIIARFHNSSFDMPFVCAATKVYFRTGALEVVEKQEAILLPAVHALAHWWRTYHIALTYRKQLVAGRFIVQWLRSQQIAHEFGATKRAARTLTTWSHSVLAQKNWRRQRAAAVSIQVWQRRRAKLAREQKLQATRTVQRWCRVWVRMERERRNRAAATVQNWYRAATQAQHKRRNAASIAIQKWYRRQIERQWRRRDQAASVLQKWLGQTVQRKHHRERQAATFLQVWYRWRMIARLPPPPPLSRTFHPGDRLWLSDSGTADSALLEMVPEHTSTELVREIESCEYDIGPTEIDWSCFKEDEEDDDGGDCCEEQNNDDRQPRNLVPSDSLSTSSAEHSSQVLVPKAVLDEKNQLQQRVKDLHQNIVQVTTEAELHNQEMEADFEERLAAYEQEVLTLQEQLRTSESEKVALQQEVAANVENIKSLKTSIRGMQTSHRDYLNKVMRAVDRANKEHAEAIQKLKKEDRVQELQTELRRLKKRQHIYETMAQGDRCEQFHGLARKLEKITSPNYIASRVEEWKLENSNGQSIPSLGLMDTIEKHISSKTRNILYRLEDMHAASPQTTTFATTTAPDAPTATVTLQQRLIAAYEEIDDLKARQRRQQRQQQPVVVENKLQHNSNENSRGGIRKLFQSRSPVRKRIDASVA